MQKVRRANANMWFAANISFNRTFENCARHLVQQPHIRTSAQLFTAVSNSVQCHCCFKKMLIYSWATMQHTTIIGLNGNNRAIRYNTNSKPLRSIAICARVHITVERRAYAHARVLCLSSCDHFQMKLVWWLCYCLCWRCCRMVSCA